MDLEKALEIYRSLRGKAQMDDESKFQLCEVLEYLYKTTGDYHYATELGGFYYEEREFKLAEKYYLIGAKGKEIWPLAGLGYIYYYGRVGKPDYEKAFTYYKKASELGDIESTYKMADMYKNGYYVEKDYEKYKQIIEGLYDKIKDERNLGAPVPDVLTRLARIRVEEGKKEEALNLYLKAKSFLAQRMSYYHFFGNFTVMKWIIAGIYSLIPFDDDYFDFFDLYEAMKNPCKVKFTIGDDFVEAEAVRLGETVSVLFEGKAYKSVEEFIMKARFKGTYLSLLNQEMGEFTLEK